MYVRVLPAASVAATGINTAKGILRHPGSSPDFLKDIFFGSNASI